MLSRRACLATILAVSAILTAILCFLPGIPLGSDYHSFADQRLLWGIPHGLDVLSNIPFVLIGMAGMAFTLRARSANSFVEASERIPYFVFFADVMLTGFGSAYYHAAPGNHRLVWDLLPMALSFMSLTDATIVERIGIKTGLRLLVPLLAVGVASVIYWHYEESQGHGDLRFYLFVQFFSPLAIAMMIALFPPRYTRTIDLSIAFVFFVLAKLCELADKQIYSLGGVVSGHALKHLAAAFSCFWIWRMLRLRRAAGSVEGGIAA